MSCGCPRDAERQTSTKSRSAAGLSSGRIVLGSAEDDVDHLLLGIAQQFRDSLFPPDAGILEAAIGYAPVMLADPVNPNIPGLHRLRDLQRPVDVIGPHRRRQAQIDS